MKKKSLSLDKKLVLNKETVAELNMQKSAILAGGKAPLTVRPRCLPTAEGTCNTFAPTRPDCQLC